MSNSYIHTADMGMLFSSITQLERYYELRLKTMNIKQELVPPPYNPILDFEIKPDSKAAESACELMGMNPANYMLVMEAMASALVADADIRRDFQELAMKVMLRETDSMSKSRRRIETKTNERQVNRNTVIQRNEIATDKMFSTSNAYRKKIEEEKELVLTRKRKLIRSMNKALDRVGNQPRTFMLSESDQKACEYLQAVGWVGFDGSRWCCKEQAIMDADLNETKKVVFELLTISKG